MQCHRPIHPPFFLLKYLALQYICASHSYPHRQRFVFPVDVCSSGDGVAAAAFLWWTCALGLYCCDGVASSVGAETGKLSRSAFRWEFALLTAGRWWILCWVRGWRLSDLVSSSDDVLQGCQNWRLTACTGCFSDLILSVAMALLLASYFGDPESYWSAMDPR
jgi:hypothetical protein